jgi:CDP-2,3-bis-(O-geranylgeranyl)-sn-glycerol synthase
MIEFWSSVFAAGWIFLPAGVANIVPIFLAKVPRLRRWNAPLDFGKKFRGRAIFGPHKTWRGVLGGVIFATLTLLIHLYFANQNDWLREILTPSGYFAINPWLVGPLFAIGALGGDAIESFAKRRLHRRPGETWLFFDQVDYVIGALLVATAPFFRLSFAQYFAIVAIYALGSLLFSIVGLKTRFKKSI